MELERYYWRTNPDAPFGWLMRVVETYLEPESNDWEALVEQARKSEPHQDIARFKRQLREGIEHPERIPDNHEHLGDAGEFDDGTDVRYLRRIWRELYPDESMPGPNGDREFREDLRRQLHGEFVIPTATTTHYVEPLETDLPGAARRTWQRCYPDEPLPE